MWWPAYLLGERDLLMSDPSDCSNPYGCRRQSNFDRYMQMWAEQELEFRRTIVRLTRERDEARADYQRMLRRELHEKAR